MTAAREDPGTAKVRANLESALAENFRAWLIEVPHPFGFDDAIAMHLARRQVDLFLRFCIGLGPLVK
jgi:hypothetical protein